VNERLYECGPYVEVKRNGVKMTVHITETTAIERREAVNEIKDDHDKIIKLQNWNDWCVILCKNSDENYYKELDKNCKAREMIASYLYRPNWNEHIKSGERSFVERLNSALDDQPDFFPTDTDEIEMGLTE
jgi:sRNA-binding carbon storage regulator CsrA